MTKNLKLKVKNTQLAAVLKKNKLKKDPTKEDKGEKKAPAAAKKKAPVKAADEIEKKEDTAKPKKVVRARKAPSNVIAGKKAKETVEETKVKEEAAAKPANEENVAMAEPKSAAPKEVAEPEKKAPEPPKEKPYRPKKTETIVKNKMIATPIVKKKDPIRKPRPAPSTPRAKETKATASPADAGTDQDRGGKKKVEKKKGPGSYGEDENKARNEKAQKKSAPSYRRQAFSRVFDSRSVDGDETWRRRRHNKQKKKKNDEPVIRPKEITITLPITVKELAAQMKIKGTEVIQKLFMQGLPVTINDALEDETTVGLIGQEFECEISIDKTQEERLQITEHSIEEEISGYDANDLEPRAPIVTVMGHVDHGKTSIIDAFRKSNITSGEAGAITQHIGAFSVQTKHGPFTVLDTPGHEAFSAIRERGANVTDIVILVVAGDEGIKPQTKEAIDKAKEAKVPIIVAINKADKPGFNADDVYRQLAENELLPEAWGGEVLTVNCSAKTKEGIETLAEMIALQSEVLELRANPTCRARGTVLESELHRGLGITATLLVQNGTLNVGDAVIFNQEYGKIKTMQDEHGDNLEHAGPSAAVRITGLSGVPSSGNEFIMLEDEREARKIAEERKAAARHEELKKRSSKSLESLMQNKVDSMQRKTLNIILKADVVGSLEAVRETLLNIPTEKVELNFVSTEVGQVSESDIEMAAASGALIVGFHTNIERHAEALLKTEKVKILLFDVIYHLVDEVKEHMISILDKVRKETESGSAKVLATFKASSIGIIAGCQVNDGIVKRSSFTRLFRDGEEIWSGHLTSLKRVQDDVKEVKNGLECGIVLEGTNNIQEGDELKFYEISYITQEL